MNDKIRLIILKYIDEYEIYTVDELEEGGYRSYYYYEELITLEEYDIYCVYQSKLNKLYAKYYQDCIYAEQY